MGRGTELCWFGECEVVLAEEGPGARKRVEDLLEALLRVPEFPLWVRTRDHHTYYLLDRTQHCLCGAVRGNGRSLLGGKELASWVLALTLVQSVRMRWFWADQEDEPAGEERLSLGEFSRRIDSETLSPNTWYLVSVE